MSISSLSTSDRAPPLYAGGREEGPSVAPSTRTSATGSRCGITERDQEKKPRGPGSETCGARGEMEPNAGPPGYLASLGTEESPAFAMRSLLTKTSAGDAAVAVGALTCRRRQGCQCFHGEQIFLPHAVPREVVVVVPGWCEVLLILAIPALPLGLNPCRDARERGRLDLGGLPTGRAHGLLGR